jgi:hypothetical protein
MGRAGKAVAWICIVSTFLGGCYSSEVFYSTGRKKEKMHAGTIEYVTTMDGTRYEFDKAPDVTNDRIAGQARLLENGQRITKDVSIPLAEVGTVRVRAIDWMTTAGVAVSLVVVAGIVGYLVTMDQLHHDLWH